MIREDILDLLRVPPDKKVRLRDYDPGWAPWHIVPADHKWVTRAVVADVVTSAIRALDLKFPEVTEQQLQAIKEARNQLKSEKPSQA